jgi:hypothetical protein
MDNFNPNPEQIKSMLRSFFIMFGGVIAGFFAGKSWISSTDVLAILSSETFIGIMTSVITAGIGVLAHRKKHAVALVDSMPEVAGVVTKPTPEGLALAKAVPSATVAPAGTVQASKIVAA